ncbi:MAG: hypothetical protein AABX16_00595, partial [Nanoarchaeota archaeon]
MKRGSIKALSRSCFEEFSRMPKQKRSQITIFIILAVIIIGILVVFFFFQQNQNKNAQTTVQKEIQPVYDYVQECASHTAYDGLVYLANTGGYFVRQDSSNADGVAYYYLDNKNFVPTKQQLGKEISLYMNNLLPFCTAGFSLFTDYTIEEDEITSQTTILEDKIIIKINYPLQI